MPRGGQALVRRGRFGREITVQITPGYLRQIPDIGCLNRPPGQDRQPPVASEPSVSLRIFRLAPTPIIVAVQTGLQTPVRSECKTVRVTGQTICVGIQGREVRVIVKPGQHDCIGVRMSHNAQTGQNLRVFAFFDVTQQKTRTIARQFRVINGNP